MTRFVVSLRRDRGLLLLLLLLLGGLPLVTTRIYASDEIKYFAYLHSLAFDRDLDFTNDYGHWIDDACPKNPRDPPSAQCQQRRTLLKANPTTGLPINEAPVGTALLWAPAFALAHVGVLLARALGARVAADGYSPPYIAAVCYASYLYGWLGLLLGYRLLRRLFDPLIAVGAVVAVWLGTSAFFYMVIAPPWSHAVSLFTVALFTTVWWTTRRPAGRRPREWAGLGLCAGLMMLVREQDALFLALPAVETLFRLGGHADLTPHPPPLRREGERDDLTPSPSPRKGG
ncbi:MAG: glycosyltransferase family 39 protein, partial [Chloroflexota bacterium]|nr:glycosyltransferase family 39 protein [Chloroflexota bacterium]